MLNPVVFLLSGIFLIFSFLNVYCQVEGDAGGNTNSSLLTFRIDFSQEPALVENGFMGFLAKHEVASTFIPQSFTSEEISIIVHVKWPAGTPSTAMQLIDRGASPGQSGENLLRDWIGTDGREAKVPMDLVISGLPAGEYIWESYHHDNSDQTGLFNVVISDASGKRTFRNIDISNGMLPIESVTVFKTLLTSDGSEIVITFAQDSWPGNSTSFFVMNGFKLYQRDTSLIPASFGLTYPIDRLRHLPVNTQLRWEKSMEAEHYLVYLDTLPNPSFYKQTVTESESLTGLMPGATYYWKVEAVNRNCRFESPVWQFTTRHVNEEEFSGKTELNFSHTRDYYNQPFKLILTSNNPNANIIYTTDSSKPSIKNGKVYHDGIAISTTMVIKALALSEKDSSSVYTQSYLFADHIARQSAKPTGFPVVWGGSSSIPADYEMDTLVTLSPDYLHSLSDAFLSVPTLSLSMPVDEWFNPNAGMYVGYPNSNISREKAVNAEFIFPGSSESFSILCGVQNQGGTSIVDWKVPKQSMRLLFKEPYGPTRLNYKLFPDSEINSINTLVVDAFLYGWVHPWDDIQRKTSLFFRDQLCSDLQNKMGWHSFHGIYVHVYINGLYWGLYDLHERPDDAFLAWYQKGSREDFDVIKHNPNTIVSGSNSTYSDLLNAARMGFKTPESLKKIEAHLDLPAFIDYMLLNFYLGNYDWAHQNYYAAVNRTDMTGFRFYTWDAEHVMRYSDVNYNNTQKNDKGGPTEIHTLLSENEEYRMMFADAVYKHCFNDGALTPESFMESFLYRKNEIDKAVILESARWGDYLKAATGTTYTRNDHWLPEAEKVTRDYIPKRRDIVISQLRNSSNRLFPQVMPPIINREISESPGIIRVSLNNPNLAEGDIYFTMDGTDPRLPGGSVKGQKYTGTLQLGKNTLLKARFKAKNTGEWSALAEEKFVVDPNKVENLTITEIMYHPEDDFPEFIELMNTTEEPVFLKGFSFSRGIDYTFNRDEMVYPGKGIVLASDTSLFLKQYRFRAYGQFRKKLSNDGETIILRNNLNLLIDSVTYSNTPPWPVIPGDGYSIGLVDLSLDNSLPSSWRVSDVKHGTPFKPDNSQQWEAGIYPNPARDNVTIVVGEQELASARFTVEIYNHSGLMMKSLQAESYNSEITLDISGLSNGFYYLRLVPDKGGFGTATLKVFKI